MGGISQILVQLWRIWFRSKTTATNPQLYQDNTGYLLENFEGYIELKMI